MDLIRKLLPHTRKPKGHMDEFWRSCLPEAVKSEKLSDSVRELYRPKEHVDMEVIFFHGLDFGDIRDFQCRGWLSGNLWSDDGLVCWPQTWLPEKFPCARILAVSYDASVMKSRNKGQTDLKQIVENLVDELILCSDVNVGQGFHCPVVLVGHSVGGLVIQQLCIYVSELMYLHCTTSGDEDTHKRLDTFLKNLRGVFYYSTPNMGLDVTKLVPCYEVVEDLGCIMEIMDIRNQEAITTLHSKFNEIRQKYNNVWRLAGVVEGRETNLGHLCGLVVERSSARVGNDFDDHLILAEDHFSICQPKLRTSMAYKKLVSFLTLIKRGGKDINSWHHVIFQRGGEDINSWHDDPLTCELMCDPVKGNDGYTYDRWTIIDNRIRKSPFVRGKEFFIACDDVNARSQLFQSFPDQENKFRSRRRQYREKALHNSKALQSEVAVEALEVAVELSNVLQWDDSDAICLNERNRILNLVKGLAPPHNEPRQRIMPTGTSESTQRQRMSINPGVGHDEGGTLTIDVPVAEHGILSQARDLWKHGREICILAVSVYFGLLLVEASLR